MMRLVRILRSTVMVRVGGGWMALDEFLVKNDPCRGEWTIQPCQNQVTHIGIIFSNIFQDLEPALISLSTITVLQVCGTHGACYAGEFSYSELGLH